MRVLISGGTGFLGRHLAGSLIDAGHHVSILTRGSRVIQGAKAVAWDGRTTGAWGHLMNHADVVVQLAGNSLSSWPWTLRTKQEFRNSRILTGLALVEAIQNANHRPAIFIQASGINHYGLKGDAADESTPPGTDFLSQLTVDWEASTEPVEGLGVRRAIVRSAIVLDRGDGLMPLLELPVKLFLGGRIGRGTQAVPWIHIKDWVGAVRFLIDKKNAQGPYNLIAPMSVSNTEFTRTLAGVLDRPHWFPAPALLIRSLLGEMSILVLEGRIARPARLVKEAYKFEFPSLHEAFLDLYKI